MLKQETHNSPTLPQKATDDSVHSATLAGSRCGGISFKRCSISGCLKKHYGRNLCRSHYAKIFLSEYQKKRRQGFMASLPKCTVKECNKHSYARGYCYNHYERFRTSGSPLGARSRLNKCTFCNTLVRHVVCSKHKRRYARLKELGLPLDYKGAMNAGSNNCNWNGGSSDYPNHHLMKKNRIIKFKQCDGKCQVCGKKAKMIHHADEDKSNHSLENLVPLCHKCHCAVHAGRKNKTSKMIQLYGISLQEMADKFGGTPSRFYSMHAKGLLNIFLKTNNGKELHHA